MLLRRKNVQANQKTQQKRAKTTCTKSGKGPKNNIKHKTEQEYCKTVFQRERRFQNVLFEDI